MSGPAATNGVSRPQDKILLVDDNPENLEVLQRVLQNSGCALLTANSGAAALEVARRNQPDLILLDILMPTLDGFETIRQLKNDAATRDAAVIFLSGLDEVRNKVRGLSLGAADYITKPFQVEEVRARVHTQLTIRRLNRETQARQEELERELRVVANVQRSLLPQTLPATAGLKLAAHYATSRYAGGDYYDLVELPGGDWGILVADAAGHGAFAAVLMAMTYAVFHTYPGPPTEPADVLAYLNRHLSTFSGEGFVTALYAVYRPRDYALRLASAGHVGPLLHRPGEPRATRLPCHPVPPLGAGVAREISVVRHALQPRDRLLFYTDGVIERQNAAREMYGVERLQEELAALATDDPQQAVEALMRHVDHFAGNRPADDDQTLLLGFVE